MLLSGCLFCHQYKHFGSYCKKSNPRNWNMHNNTEIFINMDKCGYDRAVVLNQHNYWEA